MELNQKMVDNFIKTKFLKINICIKSGDTGREETIYTRLRNQVGHFRKTLQDKKYYRSKVNELIELVKISIYD